MGVAGGLAVLAGAGGRGEGEGGVAGGAVSDPGKLPGGYDKSRVVVGLGPQLAGAGCRVSARR